MFKGKKFTVIGLGLLGRGVGDVAYLAEEGAELIVTDLKTKSELKESLDKLKKFKNIKYTLGRHVLKDFENRDFILKAAGVPLESPYIIHARKHKIEVLMSTALFVKLSSARVVGVTGTRGKTTVSYMLYEILRRFHSKSSGKVFLGGNIQGVATLPMLKKVKKGDVAVLELDSWQLQGFGDMKISPDVSVFTSFMPDHLNYYKGSLSRYFKDKENIFKFQDTGGIFIAGNQIKRKLPSRTKIVSDTDLPKGVSLKIPGRHNAYNAAIAYVTSVAMGVPKSVAIQSLESFLGVPHRLEKVRTHRGVAFYNDTTSTTPDALAAALNALGDEKNIVLIAGGDDKGIDLDVTRIPLAKHCKYLSLLTGTGTERMLSEKVIPPNIPHSLNNSIKSALKNALNKADNGDIILLSPGFASFGMFKNEYDRGEQFVKELKKI